MAGLRRLLAQGLFPKELPPAFRSRGFADAVQAANNVLPAPPKCVTALSQHNLARAGGVRRPIGIPNPISHFRLTSEISVGWDEIRRHISTSRIAASRPLLRGNTLGRAAGPANRFSSLPRLRVQARRHGRYLLRADIAEFYRTLYTHSIPWALHTKAVGGDPKNHNNTKLLGVRIDKAVQSGQRKQTNGIPIGPDTSFIIGEVLLAAVDAHLPRIGTPLAAFRFYDDYEFSFERAADAEDFLAGMHGALAEFNLNLNPAKTGIVPLPVELDNSWRDPVRRFKLGLTEQEKEKNLIGYFDYVFELKRTHPVDPVVGYAISRLEGESLGSASWKIAEALLLQAMSVEPDAIQQVAVAFAKAYSNRLPISTDDLTQGLTLIIRRHAPLNHGFEVAWALWIALSLNCTIVDPEANSRLGAMTDPAVALLALDAQQRGLLPSLDVTGWERLMTAEQLEGEHWLLAYEASTKGWLPTYGGGDHVASHVTFEFLRNNSVSFYTRVRTPTKASIAAMPTWRPGYGDVAPAEDDDFLAIFGDLP